MTIDQFREYKRARKSGRCKDRDTGVRQARRRVLEHQAQAGEDMTNANPLIRAAELLEREAKILYDRISEHGDWGGYTAQRQHHAELIEAAADLRAMAAGTREVAA